MAGWLLWVAPSAAGDVDPFLACQQEADTRSPRERHRCVYMAARKTGDFARADAVLSTATVHPEWALLALGHVRSAVGDERAEATYLSAAEALATEPEGVVRALLGLRSLWTQAGRHDEARDAIARARRTAGDDGPLRARVDAEDARLHWRQGDAEGAVALASGVDLTDADHQLRVLTYHVLAGATLELGLVATSWSYSERLVRLTQAAGDRYVESTARLNALSMLEDHPELSGVDREAFAVETLAVAEAGGNPFTLVGARCALGVIRRDEGLLGRCLREARDLDDPVSEVIALRKLAEVTDDADQALIWLDEAYRVAAGTGLRYNVAQVHHRRAAVLWPRDRRAAEEAAEAAVQTIEGIVDTQGDELARAGFASIWRTAWLDPAQRWRAAGDDARAYLWVERMRARELRAQRWGRPVDSAAKAQITALQDRLWDDLPPAARTDVVAELAAVEAEARVALPVVDLAATQARLEADQALVVYVLADEPTIDSWAWVIEHDRVQSLPLPEPQAVGPRVDLLLGLDHVPTAAIDALRADVVAPVLRATDAARLVVVPDGPLHRLPFGLLVEDRAVAMVPSATVWSSLTSDEAVRGVVSLADPAEAAGVALPFARGEGARWVERLGGVLRVGSEATSEALTQSLGDHDVVHLATHAEVDGARAAHELVLADGALGPSQVASWPLEGKVVVLAACRGGDGPVFTSEGAISLARAFLQGGARTVLTSVVPLRDDQAAALFADVADAWAAGGSLAEAVHRVQRQHGATAPGELGWAGLVVLGDGDVALTGATPPSSGWLRWLTACLLAAAAGGVLWRFGGPGRSQ